MRLGIKRGSPPVRISQNYMPIFGKPFSDKGSPVWALSKVMRLLGLVRCLIIREE